jgi:pimeloyl-ACP methyl ester carboxylesterase
MPFLTIRGAKIYYEEHGRGTETIVFSHGLLLDGRMFDAQVRRLSDRYRCVVFDHRGQGRSDASEMPMIDMETLYDDASVLIETLGLGAVHWVGLSMGGFVGLRLAARRPELLKSLTLIATAADIEPPKNMSKYAMLTRVARFGNPAWVSSPVLKLMFGESFLKDPQHADERRRWVKILETRPRSIYRAVRGVLYRTSVVAECKRIAAPCLVIHGAEDRAISRRRSEHLAELTRARLVILERCGHLATVESPDSVSDAIEEFLENVNVGGV